MAEIKSTLDLIMEKTKNLTLSDEERDSLRVGEWTGMVRGWVQKYMDNLMGIPDIGNELARIRKENRERIGSILREEILARIDPEDGNERLFRLMEEFSGILRDEIEDEVRSYKDRLEKEKAAKKEALLASLAADRITGRAVIPNIERDPEWRNFREGLKKEFSRQLSLRCNGMKLN